MPTPYNRNPSPTETPLPPILDALRDPAQAPHLDGGLLAGAVRQTFDKKRLKKFT